MLKAESSTNDHTSRNTTRPNLPPAHRSSAPPRGRKRGHHRGFRGDEPGGLRSAGLGNPSGQNHMGARRDFHCYFDHPRRPCLAQGRRFSVRNGADQNCSGGAGAGEEVEERTSVVSFRSSVRTRPERFLCWALKADDRRVITANVRKWRNWQTHQLEGLTLARAWGFESPLPHHLFLKKSRSQLP